MKSITLGQPRSLSFTQNSKSTSSTMTAPKQVETNAKPAINSSSYGIIIHDYNPNSRIDMEQIKKLEILNLRTLGASTISGGTFSQKPIRELQALKQAGIESIVDFRSEATNELKIKCDRTKLRYFHFPLDGVENFSNENYFTKKSTGELVIKDKFVRNLKQYFDIINNSKTYIGCHYGIDRTNIGVLLNYLLNSKNNDNAPEMKSWAGVRLKSVINKDIKTIKKIFKRLTDEQRELLNLDENSKTIIQNKILKLLSRNGH